MAGKFIFRGEQKLYVRGVTYGTFHPRASDGAYPDRHVVAQDFARMAAAGINTVRTYTRPPGWALDLAQAHGLCVMVGLPWEQHVAFLADRGRARAIEAHVRAEVRACAAHPAILCYTLGNEIPAPIVRWHGPRAVQAFLARLYRAVKEEDPAGLVTYVNYPSTEYLDLPFLDFFSFNVYLEEQPRLAAYLARLQNLAGERPVLLAEIGVDSRRNGRQRQAEMLAWQIDTAFAAGCAGACVFAWTDEWYRGGQAVADWDFGLTDRARTPKPALAAVQAAFQRAPFPPDRAWPRCSVIVCSYNGGRTIRDCLEGLLEQDYPDVEVIVVDDGSRDATARIAREYGCRVITTPNQGLSHARNVGLRAAGGAVVAYIDDDARPDRHWLAYLIATLTQGSYAGVGGPNLPVPADGPIAACVANAPGGPTHVLLSDQEAEHIPGCNMAFWKRELVAIGGFDPQFRVAGDDVDVCWQIRERGGTLGFSPAAVVWHHRRSSVGAYWRQQRGYGQAEALLARKWPAKYNRVGHVRWAGRLYDPGWPRMWGSGGSRIYQGVWGSAPFQSLYQPAPNSLWSAPVMPEWYMVILGLAGVAALGLLWRPLLLALPLLALALAAALAQAALRGAQARFPGAGAGYAHLRALTALLHLIQPLARLSGRLRGGLTPWRRHGASRLAPPWPATTAVWSERWRAPEAWPHALEAALQAAGATVRRGGGYDRWDLQVGGGLLGVARLRLGVEEHGAGRQLARVRAWPRCWPGVFGLILVALVGAWAAADHVWLVAALLAAAAALIGGRTLYECAAAMGHVAGAAQALQDEANRHTPLEESA